MEGENKKCNETNLEHLYSQFFTIAEMRAQQSSLSDQQLLYLSAGALSIFIGLFAKLCADMSLRFFYNFSLICFVITITSVLISFHVSDRAFSHRLEILDHLIQNERKVSSEILDSDKLLIDNEKKIWMLNKNT